MGRRSGRLFRRPKKKQQKNGPHAKRSVFGSESEVYLASASAAGASSIMRSL